LGRFILQLELDATCRDSQPDIAINLEDTERDACAPD
jgi:hypothetical protein